MSCAIGCLLFFGGCAEKTEVSENPTEFVAETKVSDSSAGAVAESVAETKETQEPVRSEYENQVLTAYDKAVTMAGWFRISTAECVMNDSVEKDGTEYYRVKNYSTMNTLKEELCNVFTKEYAEYLLANSYIKYEEIDNVLYAVVADRGTDIFVGKETCQVEGDKEGGDKASGTLIVVTEVLSEDNPDKVIGYQNYEFPYVIEDGKVLFTDFPEIR